MPDPSTVVRPSASPIPYDHKQVMDGIVVTAQLIWSCRADEASQILSRTHSVMPIIDPTKYHSAMKDLEIQEVFVSAILAAQRVLGKNAVVAALLDSCHASMPADTNRGRSEG